MCSSYFVQCVTICIFHIIIRNLFAIEINYPQAKEYCFAPNTKKFAEIKF